MPRCHEKISLTLGPREVSNHFSSTELPHLTFAPRLRISKHLKHLKSIYEYVLAIMSNNDISPTKETVPVIAPPTSTHLHPPPSPRTHRTLRRLQSAHSLGSSQNNQPSLISQQHKQALQRNLTPSLKDPIQTPTISHTRGRSNSDVTNMTPPNPGSAGRRPLNNRKPITAEAQSLDRIIREGPPDGDLIGGLEITRLKILDQGIKSDSDGMVRKFLPDLQINANIIIVLFAHLRMAHTTQRPNSRNRFLPFPHTPRRIPSILQNPQ